MKFCPHDYQRAITSWIVDHDRCNVWSGMGTGKTGATLAALQALDMVANPFPALVLAPLRVARTTWPGECQKWAAFNQLMLLDWSGSSQFPTGTPDIVAVNYDNVAALVAQRPDWPWRTVIADESTRLKSFRLKQGGKRASALGKVAHKHTRRWVNLTGTPAPNGLIDLWGQQWFVDAGQRLGRSFDAFERRWFAWRRHDDDNPYARTRFLLPGAEEQIYQKLSDCTITVRAEDFMDLPPLVENVVPVELPPKARKHYRELERELFTQLEGHEITAVNAAAKTMKCLQAANGALYVNPEGDWKGLHDEKIEALGSILEEAAGTPVLVAYHFKSDLERIQRAFPFARTLGADGTAIEEWNAGRIPLLLVHPASAGHGLNLQDGGNILAFFGLWWDLEQHQQVIERIGPTRQLQSGRRRSTYVHYIVAEGTVDEIVLKRLKTKRSVQDLLLEAMKENQ